MLGCAIPTLDILFGRPRQRFGYFSCFARVRHRPLHLTTRQVNFTPIGPAPDGMAGLRVAPDKKNAYTVITKDVLGNKRCEFWAF